MTDHKIARRTNEEGMETVGDSSKIICPHCSGDIRVLAEASLMPARLVTPTVTDACTPEQCEEARRKCLEMVEAAVAPEEVKAKLKAMFSDQGVTFFPSQVEGYRELFVKLAADLAAMSPSPEAVEAPAETEAK